MAQIKMVADVYSHIIDDDRRVNAARLEEAFYSGRQAEPEEVVEKPAEQKPQSDQELLLSLLQSPVWLNCLRRLLSRCKIKRQILSFERVCFFSTYLEFGNTNYADFVLQYI